MRTPMIEKNNSIFRAEAVQRHLQAQQATVFPRLVRPSTFLLLWTFLSLLIVGVFIGKLPVPSRLNLSARSASRPGFTPDLPQAAVLGAGAAFALAGVCTAWRLKSRVRRQRKQTPEQAVKGRIETIAILIAMRVRSVWER